MKVHSPLAVLLALALLLASRPLLAVTLSDSFDASHDYASGNVTGTIWSGVLNTGKLLSGVANTSSPGQLAWVVDSNAGWENGLANSPTLYRLVSGDFSVSVQVTSISYVPYADGGIIVRAPNLGDAGPGEDYVALRYYAGGFNATRNTDGGITGNTNYAALDPWLRVDRQGNIFRFFTKPTESSTWQLRDAIVRSDLGPLSTLQVGLWFGTFSSYSGTVTFDNFQLTAVPEPSGLLLLSLGLVGLVVAGSRRIRRRM